MSSHNSNFKKNFKNSFAKFSSVRQEQFLKYIIKRPQKHKFHIVSPSPWPFLTSISAFLFVSGMVMYMHNVSGGGLTLFIGILSIIISMILWFQDIIREATFMGYHTLKVQLGLRLGFLLFIVSEVMFFFAFFWAYFHASVCPSIFVGGVWPPDGIVSYLVSSENILSQYYTYNEDFNENIYQISGSNCLNSPEIFGNMLVDPFNDGWFDRIIIVAHINDSGEEYFLCDPFMSEQFIFPSDFENKIFVDKLEASWIKLFSPATPTANDIMMKSSGEILVTITDTGLLINPLSIPLLNTIILLSSGAILTLSHTYLRLEKYFSAIIALVVTIFFGLAFFGFQIFEYTYAGFSINDGIYGTVFYMLTGFHGFHVFIGTVFLIVCLVRFFYHHFTPANHFGFEAAIWYWHFVDVVWIFLFFFVYLWPNYSFFYPSNEFSYICEFESYKASINLSSSVLGLPAEEFLPPYDTSTISLSDKNKLIGLACEYIEEKYTNGKNINTFLVEQVKDEGKAQVPISFDIHWDYFLNIWIHTYKWDLSSIDPETVKTPFSLYEEWVSSLVNDYNEVIADMDRDGIAVSDRHPVYYNKFNPIIMCHNHLPVYRLFGNMGTCTGVESTYEEFINSKIFNSWNLTDEEAAKYSFSSYPTPDLSIFNKEFVPFE